MAITKDNYLGLIPNNRWGCKYRRMETQYKRAYQRGYTTFASLINRPDFTHEPVQKILQKLLDFAKWLLFFRDRSKKGRMVVEKEKEIQDMIEALP